MNPILIIILAMTIIGFILAYIGFTVACCVVSARESRKEEEDDHAR